MEGKAKIQISQKVVKKLQETFFSNTKDKVNFFRILRKQQYLIHVQDKRL